jgi:lysophospholipase L1-like esterase
MNIQEYIYENEDEKPLERIVTDGGFCGIFRTIACIGDSLSSGEFESKDENGNTTWHDLYEYSWGQYIARDTGAKVYNFSCGGMTTWAYHEFAERKGFWAEDKLCQAYIIALGVNDIWQKEIGSVADINLEDYTKNNTTVAGHYGKIIQRLKTMQPHAKFFLVSIPRHEEVDEGKRKYRDLLQDMTKIFDNTYLIDLYEYAPIYDSKFWSKYGMGGHLRPTGYIVTAKMIESYIDYIIRKNPDDFIQVGFIGTKEYREDL